MTGVERLPVDGERLLVDSRFAWCVGIEDTFIGQPITHSGRPLDEYELTQHYRFWRDDLDRAASLGVTGIRYGIPWYRVNSAPGRFDWAWTDQVLEYAIAELGLTVIADLVHYGVPDWIPGAFADPGYPAAVAEYAAAFAERYSGLVSHFTPLNEPTITAQFCGQRGLWPPYLRGDDGWAEVVIGVAEGIQATVRALRATNPTSVIVHVEAAKVVSASDPSLEKIAAEVRARNYLPTDLVLGRVDPDHPLAEWLTSCGIASARLAKLAEQPPLVDVIGVNYYPEISVREIVRYRGRAREVAVDGWARGLATALGEFGQRYGLPVFVSETSTEGDAERRVAWLRDSIAAVQDLRREGAVITGFTWWPLFDFIDWSYSLGSERLEDFLVRVPRDGGGFQLVRPSQPSDSAGHDPDTFLRRMGIWNLETAPDGTLDRVESEVARHYRATIRDTTD